MTYSLCLTTILCLITIDVDLASSGMDNISMSDPISEFPVILQVWLISAADVIWIAGGLIYSWNQI
jgi:hypothetical protein